MNKAVHPLAELQNRLRPRGSDAGQPLEFFAEAGPVFRLTQGGAVDADGGIGGRLYLGSASR